MTWKKGQSGNPAGSVSRRPITDAIRGLLSRPITDPLEDKRITYAQLIAIQRVKLAAQGDKDAQRDVKEWVEGKAAQAIIGGEEDDPPVKVCHTTEEIINLYNAQRGNK